MMKLTWLGHSGFRLETGDSVVLIDPWLSDNPSFPSDRRDEAIRDVTHILLTHGHGDHASDALSIAKEADIPIAGMFDMIGHWESSEGIEGIGFNKGGTIELGDLRATMVNAVHSSSLDGGENGPRAAGSEAGYVLRAEGKVIYLSGDTDVMADMGVIADRYAPTIGILCAGGHFTMDMDGAAYAARKFFQFDTVIPCHFGTFPVLEQSADRLIEGLPGVEVRVPEVLEPMEL